jgi:hypothetical protein
MRGMTLPVRVGKNNASQVTGRNPNEDGFGLYYHDCRYLSGYEIQMAGTRPNVLASNSDQGSMAWFELTNVKLDFKSGRIIPAQMFGISLLGRLADSESAAVHDTLIVTKYDAETQELPLSFRMQAGFEDVKESNVTASWRPHKRGALFANPCFTQIHPSAFRSQAITLVRSRTSCTFPNVLGRIEHG